MRLDDELLEAVDLEAERRRAAGEKATRTSLAEEGLRHVVGSNGAPRRKPKAAPKGPPRAKVERVVAEKAKRKPRAKPKAKPKVAPKLSRAEMFRRATQGGK